MPPKTWNNIERAIAKYIGGVRRGADYGDATGGKNDIVHPWLSIECKYGASITYQVILDALEQAERAAEPHQLPIVFVKKKRKPPIICIKPDKFKEWYL